MSESNWVSLKAHPTARSQAVAVGHLSQGSAIISEVALSTILLPSEKGRRCDSCHVLHKVLRKCSGCVSYWYCDTKCQNVHWKSNHKKICKVFNKYTASPDYQTLSSHEKIDALLLSHLVAQLYSSKSHLPPKGDEASPFVTFYSLLPGPVANHGVPCICPISTSSPISSDTLEHLYARFGNNNFTIHSHLVSFAHGIFPLTSRFFNHSCVPNAAAKYILAPYQSVRLEVVALRDIAEGEEICLPYLDPALLQSRQHIFELTYGFRCTCPSCVYFQHIGTLPNLPENPAERLELQSQLREFVFPTGIKKTKALSNRINYETIPRALLPAFHESYLTELSETFSRSSHEGKTDEALEIGATLLALYALIYPLNYPQIGMHLFEMAKTAWNALVTNEDNSTTETLRTKAQCFLVTSRDILEIFGPEGDEGGPLKEMEKLRNLLDELI